MQTWESIENMSQPYHCQNLDSVMLRLGALDAPGMPQYKNEALFHLLFAWLGDCSPFSL